MPNRSIGTSLAALALGFSTARIVLHFLKHLRCADHVSRIDYEEEAKARLEPRKTANRLCCSSNEAHRLAEQKYWVKSVCAAWFTAAATSAAVVVGGLAACFAHGAFMQAQRQANAAEDANRPWITIQYGGFGVESIEPDGNDGIKISFRINIVNVGKSPASAVKVTLKATPNISDSFLFSEQRRICPIEPAKIMSQDIFNGNLLFQNGDVIPEMAHASIEKDRLPSFKGKYANLIACIDYVWEPEWRLNNARHHQTSVIWTLIDVSGKPIDFSDPRHLPAVSDVKLKWLTVDKVQAGKIAR